MKQAMHRILICTVGLLAALWLGGTVWLMLGVQSLFAARREIAVEAAPILFNAFERYHLMLAIATSAAAFILWRSVRLRRYLLLLVMAALATAVVLVSALWLTPAVEALRLAGEGGSPQFKMLHGISMMLYLCEALLLAATMITLTWHMPTATPQP